MPGMISGHKRRIKMREKYDLKKMLEEIKEEGGLLQKKKAKMTQEDIKKILAKKRKGEKK